MLSRRQVFGLLLVVMLHLALFHAIVEPRLNAFAETGVWSPSRCYVAFGPVSCHRGTQAQCFRGDRCLVSFSLLCCIWPCFMPSWNPGSMLPRRQVFGLLLVVMLHLALFHAIVEPRLDAA